MAKQKQTYTSDGDSGSTKKNINVNNANAMRELKSSYTPKSTSTSKPINVNNANQMRELKSTYTPKQTNKSINVNDANKMRELKNSYTPNTSSNARNINVNDVNAMRGLKGTDYRNQFNDWVDKTVEENPYAFTDPELIARDWHRADAERKSAETLLSGETSKGQSFPELLESAFDGGVRLSKEEIDNLGGVIVDKKTGKQANMDYVNALVNDYNSKAEQYKVDSDNLTKGYKAREIGDEDYLKADGDLKKRKSELDKMSQELDGYDYLTGMDYYNWLKNNGTDEDIRSFESYVASYDDSFLQGMTNAYKSAKIKQVNTPFEIMDIAKLYLDKNNPDAINHYLNDSFSAQNNNTANEIAQYVTNGRNGQGFRAYTLNTISTIMPTLINTIDSLMFGNLVGGANSVVQLANKAGNFSADMGGVSTAIETFRQRLSEGNSVDASLWNAIPNGVAEALIERFNVGNVVNMTEFFSGVIGIDMLGAGLFSLPKVVPMLLNVADSAGGEMVEELVGAVTSRLIDDIENSFLGFTDSDERVSLSPAVFDKNTIINFETFGKIGEGGLTDQMIMAGYGAILQGAPNMGKNVINSVKKYNCAGEAIKYYQERKAYAESMGDMKSASMYQQGIDFFTNERRTYENTSVVGTAVQTQADMAEPAPSLEETLNVTANGFRLNVSDEVNGFIENEEFIQRLERETSDALAKRGINIDTNLYTSLDDQTRRNVKEVAKYANALGINTSFDSDENIKEKVANVLRSEGKSQQEIQKILDKSFVDGYYDNSTGRIVLNTNTELGHLSTMIHEITHGTEASKYYGELESFLKEYYGNDLKQNFDNSKVAYEALSADAQKESVAKTVQDKLILGNEEFVRKLIRYNNSLAYRIYDNIRAMVSSDVKTQLENTFEKAFRDAQNQTKIETSLQYALKDKSGVVYNLTNSQYNQNVDELLRMEPISDATERFNIDGRNATEREIKQYMFDLFAKNGNVAYNDILGEVELTNRMARNDVEHGYYPLKLSTIDSVIPTIEQGLIVDVKHTENTGKPDSALIVAPVIIDKNEYGTNRGYTVVRVNQTPDGNRFYVHDAVTTTLNKKGELVPLQSTPSMTDSNRGTSPNNSFSLGEQDVKYDSKGNILSEQQQDYFKNSKVRDDNGNLLAVYHGTDADFNEFNPRDFGLDGETAEGFGIYLTDNPEIAKAYGNRMIEGYANITNPASSKVKTIDNKTLENLIKATVENEAQQLVDNGDYDTIDEAIRDTWISNYTNTYEKSMDDNYRDVAETILRMNHDDMNIIQEVMSGLGTRNYDSAYDFYDILKNVTGIDGFETIWEDSQGNKSKIYLALDSNQVKNSNNENPSSNPDIRFSLGSTDSEGRNLSKEQQDYFKDSKVRDENGNLMTMYHGTRGDFTVFDLAKGGESNSKAGIGFWFTPSKQGANNFANNIWYGDGEGKAMELYLNITNPYVYETIDNSEIIDNLRNQLRDINDRKVELKRRTNPFSWMDDYSIRYEVRHGYSAEEIAKDGHYKVENVKEYIKQLEEYDNLENRRKQLESELDEVRYSDAYEQFRTDIYKLAGQSADQANTGGIGMQLNNPKETLQKYRDGLIEQGHDGIIIKGTRYDSSVFGGDNDQYVAFYPNQIKNVDNLNPTENQDIRFALGEKGDTQESVQNEGQYFDYGMNPARNVDILRNTEAGPTSRFWNNLANSQYASDEEAQRIKKMVEDGLGAYEQTSRKKQNEEAKKMLRNMGMEDAFKYMMNSDSVSTMDVDNALGRTLLNEMRLKGLESTENYRQLESRMQWRATMQGQALEAWKGFRDSTPEGQIVTIRSEIERIQQGLNERYGDRAYNIELDEDLIAEYLRARTDEERDAIREQIARDVAKQIPPTAMEQLNSFRHLSMLFNPRTWVKNRLANTAFGYINEGTRVVRSVLETIASEIGKNNENSVFHNMERQAGTYNPFSKEDRAQLKRFKERYHTRYKNIDMKYSAIDAGNVLLGTGFGEEVSRYRDSFTFKFLNKASEINAKMMSDAPGMSTAYAKSLIGYLKANNLDIDTMSEEQIQKAEDFAINEAKYATFNSYNKLASDIAKFSNDGSKARRIIIESFLPFKRTPLNLLRTGFRYTPVGLAETMTYELSQLKKGKITANQFIDNMAQGMTGSALMALGMLLSQMGIFKTKDDDPDRKQYYDQELGEQEYSINWDGGSYTIDWLDPMIVPLAMGAELNKYVQRGEYSLDDAINMIASIADPMFETSMLSGISKNLSNYSQGTTQWWGKIAQNAVTNYMSQYVPSIFGAIARTIDDTRRSTYTDKGTLDKFVRTTKNKLPLVSMTNEPYINRRGQEEKSQDLGMGMAGRAILNFVSPGYYQNKDIDKYDEELYRLYDETGDISSLPSNATKTLTYNDEDYKFTPEQYTQWQETRWQTEAEYVNQFIGSNAYQNLTDEERVDTIKDIRSYAQKVAKKEFLESQGYEYTDDKELAESDDKYVYDKQLSGAQGAVDNDIELYSYFDYLNNSGSKQAEKVKYLEESGLSQKQKEYLWSLNDYKKSYEDVYKKVFGEGTSTSSKKKSSSKNSKKVSSSKSTKKTKAKKVSTSGAGSGGKIAKSGKVSSNLPQRMVNNPVNTTKVADTYLKAYSSSMNKTRKASAGGSSTVVCPKCGNKVSSASGRCPICGAKL